jgi:hypothetical protein
MRRIVIAASLSALFAAASGAHAWDASVDDNGLRMVTGSGTWEAGDAQGTALLQLSCTPGAGGQVIWQLQLDDPARLAAFGIDDFEGPDAVGSREPRSRLELTGAGMLPKLRTAVIGFYGPVGGRFVLEFSAPANQPSQAGLLAESISSLTTAIVWSTDSTRAKGGTLKAVFPTAEVGSGFADTMQGCGPAPDLTAATLARYADRTPQESGILADRAVAWRLHGLLGRRIGELGELLEVAEPLHVDGDVYFLAGHAKADPGNAAVLLFDAASGAYDAVLIRAGKAVRSTSGKQPINAPDAARQYVADRLSR